MLGEIHCPYIPSSCPKSASGHVMNVFFCKWDGGTFFIIHFPLSTDGGGLSPEEGMDGWMEGGASFIQFMRETGLVVGRR